MKKLLLILPCLLLSLTIDANGQSRPSRIAYDYCMAYPGDNGYEPYCQIVVIEDRYNGLVVMAGTEPVWSADGLRIAIVDGHIQAYSLADGSVTPLTTGNSLNGTPRWSPDNTKVAFVTNRDGTAELYVMNPDGTAPTRLTENLGVRGTLAWSPDSGAIAFTGTVDGLAELFVVGADGLNARRLTFNVGFKEATPPSWSPDGARIAFDCGSNICTVGPDGSNLTRLTADGASFGAAFSPVDGRIAFLTGRFEGVELAIMAADGSATRIAPGFWAGQHAWSPDGRSLAFVKFFVGGYACPADGSCIDGQYDLIYTANSDGTGLAEIGLGHHPQWAPAVPGHPIATFMHACAGTACAFDASGSFDSDGTIASYLWNFGDGTTATGPAPSHTYATGAQYEVTLTVTDNAGEIGVARQWLSTNALPVASLTIACSGPTCTFDASGSTDPDGTIQGYTWMFGDGQSLQTAEPTVTHSYVTGTFSMTLSIVDNGGAVVVTEPRTVTAINPVPVAAWTVSCVVLTCTFDGSASSDDSDLTYWWNFGDGDLINVDGKVVSHTYPSWGTYTAAVWVIDSAGQVATATKTLTVGTERMHVGDLDATITTSQKVWSVTLFVRMEQANHQPVSGVTVNGTWDDGTAASCVTSGDGRCWIGKGGIPRKTTAVTFTVTGAVNYALLYQQTGNHDPDGDSNGTVIRIARQ